MCGEGGEEVLVQRQAVAVERLAQVHVGLEPRALFGRGR
jgi:hypothetical protein